MLRDMHHLCNVTDRKGTASHPHRIARSNVSESKMSRRVISEIVRGAVRGSRGTPLFWRAHGAVRVLSVHQSASALAAIPTTA